MDIIWFLCWAYLVLSVFALLYTCFFQRSKSQAVLHIIFTYFAFGVCMLIVNILFALFPPAHLFLLDVSPEYLIVLALLNLIFSFGSISHPAAHVGPTIAPSNGHAPSAQVLCFLHRSR